MADDEVAKQLRELNNTLKEIFLPKGFNLLEKINGNLVLIASGPLRK